MFGEIGIEKLLLLLCVVLLLFDAKRLPDIGASMGRGIREFRRSMAGVSEALTDGLAQAERGDMPRVVPESPLISDDVDGRPKRLSA